MLILPCNWTCSMFFNSCFLSIDLPFEMKGKKSPSYIAIFNIFFPREIKERRNKRERDNSKTLKFKALWFIFRNVCISTWLTFHEGNISTFTEEFTCFLYLTMSSTTFSLFFLLPDSTYEISASQNQNVSHLCTW